MNFHELVKAEGKERVLAKGEHVFIQGAKDSSLYFVESGLLKAYYSSEAGKESIKSFLTAGDTIGSLASIYANAPCSFSLLCLEDSVLQAIPFDLLYENSKKHLELANEMIEFLLQLSMKKERREYEFLSLDPEARYCELIKGTPSLMDKVTQNDLARYLGVTPVGLSRIKKRVGAIKR